MTEHVTEPHRPPGHARGASDPSMLSLWILPGAPLVWALHFVISYSVAAVWCAKAASRAASLDGARVAIAVLTAVALAGIAFVAVRARRRMRDAGPRDPALAGAPHDQDTDAGRDRFVGFAALLLSGMSAIAVVYAAVVVVFVETCR